MKVIKFLYKLVKITLILSGIALWMYILEPINTMVFETNPITNIECIDGDSFKGEIDGDEVNVELEYITTTKDEYYVESADAYTCNILMDAQEVQVEYEASDLEEKDGEIEGWIWIIDNDNNILLQEEIAKRGYVESTKGRSSEYTERVDHSIIDTYNIYEGVLNE